MIPLPFLIAIVFALALIYTIHHHAEGWTRRLEEYRERRVGLFTFRESTSALALFEITKEDRDFFADVFVRLSLPLKFKDETETALLITEPVHPVVFRAGVFHANGAHLYASFRYGKEIRVSTLVDSDRVSKFVRVNLVLSPSEESLRVATRVEVGGRIALAVDSATVTYDFEKHDADCACGQDWDITLIECNFAEDSKEGELLVSLGAQMVTWLNDGVKAPVAPPDATDTRAEPR